MKPQLEDPTFTVAAINADGHAAFEADIADDLSRARRALRRGIVNRLKKGETQFAVVVSASDFPNDEFPSVTIHRMNRIITEELGLKGEVITEYSETWWDAVRKVFGLKPRITRQFTRYLFPLDGRWGQE